MTKIAAQNPPPPPPQASAPYVPRPGESVGPAPTPEGPAQPTYLLSHSAGPRASSNEPPPLKLKAMGRKGLIAGGILAAASGAGFCLMARGIRLRNDAAAALRTGRDSDDLPPNHPEAFTAEDEARYQAQSNRGDIFMITGAFTGPLLFLGAAASFTIGGILYARGKNPYGIKISANPVLTPQFAGLSLSGRF